MGKSGRVTICEVAPGFEAIRGAVAARLRKGDTTVVSSGAVVQLRLMDAFAGNPEFVDAMAGGTLELITTQTLVGKLAAAAGVPTMPTLDIDRQAALVSLVARSLSEDSAFAASKHLPGFSVAAASTLHELRHERVGTSDLLAGSRKLQDIAFLQIGLDEELRRRSYATLSEKIEAVLEATPQRSNELRHLLWLPEKGWPELRLRLVEWMVRAGIDVTFLAERHPANPGFFSATKQLKARFPDATFEVRDSVLPPGSALFSEGEAPPSAGTLKVLEASDDFIETEWALRECRRRFRNEGLDPKDIVLFARSLETYGPMLLVASDRERQPISVDYPEPLMAHPFVRYVLRAMRSVQRNSVAEAVSLLRSGYGNVDRERRREAEQRVRELAKSDDLWQAMSDDSKQEGSPLPAWISAVAQWKKIATGAPRKPSAWLKGLEELVVRTPWLETTTPREQSVRDVMVRSLNVAMLALDPHVAFPLEQFVDFVEQTWAASDYRVRTDAGIRVVSDPAAIGDAKVVIALGLVEGRFPSRRAEDPILLDRDRRALEEIVPGLKLADSYERAMEDDRDFYRLLCSCEDVTLCFPATVGEDEQSRAPYLLDIEKIDGVPKQEQTFAQRFPQTEECNTEADVLAAIVWHKSEIDAHDSILERAESLRLAYEQSTKNELSDDIVRARLGTLPDKIRLSHLRSLAQCPFQYFVRHRLGLRSAKGDHAYRVIVNSIRRSNFMQTTKEEFYSALLKGLEIELQSLQGVLSEHEMQVIRFSAPATLEQFAATEIKSRQLWGLTPIMVAPQDDQAGLSCKAKIKDIQVSISPSIDVLYKKDGTDDIVPMRVGWESEDNPNMMENRLVMVMHLGDPKYVMFDAYNVGKRRLFRRYGDGSRRPLASRGNLGVDIGPKPLKELREEVANWMEGLLNIARSGEPKAKANAKVCERCDLGSFCRAAPFSDPAVDWSAPEGTDAE